MLEDRNKNLWIGTTNGLYLVPFEGSLKKNEIIEFKTSEKKGSISSNSIQDIFEDSRGQIWVATSDGGLNKYNSDAQTFQAFTRQDGLLSDATQAIEEDLLGNLWISTNQGLSRFNIAKNTFENF